ncbi:4Fe-4S binding protein [Maridesulfovibrio sp.]|uniref:4Fe-4S binding protein n=1 Tax=Maridesulfovibrio sp. TaxID=2795000 RepID=UPI002A18A73B|nr:4Fe-4S binding protein [Maridesulfovibrio sp.]
MSCSKLKLICFSPTRTTRAVLDCIAEGIGADEVDVADVTLPENVPASCDCNGNDLVIIGAPVYGGRLPLVAVERFSALKANGVPAALVVVYGNRAYEDALVELKDITEKAGLKPVAAAAFIGEHSFSTESAPVAAARPDMQDREKAEEFGRSVARKLAEGDAVSGPSIDVPGDRPYKERKENAPAAPFSSDECRLCGSCAEVCPTGAITVGETVETDPEKCILCCACIRACELNARIMEVPRILAASKWLVENCSERREPEMFI